MFEILKYYVENKSVENYSQQEQISDMSLQRLLWLGDFLQNDTFQEECIKNLIMKNINSKNVLIFLKESFKKLKACEQSSDVWYNLLNSTMNYASSNIKDVFDNNTIQDFEKINYKLFEEIIERTLKNMEQSISMEESKIIVQLLQISRKKQDFIELFEYQRQSLIKKKINYKNHPSISWKLSNLKSIINKETNPFTFNGMQWKLVAKNEDLDNNQKILRIYLKLLSQPKQQLQNQDNLEIKRILSIYFQLQINNKEIQKLHDFSKGFQVKHVVSQNLRQFVLYEIQDPNIFNQYTTSDKKLEFTIYLSIDHVYSFLLNNLSNNYQDFKTKTTLGQIYQDDLIAIGKSWPSQMQEPALNFACIYATKSQKCTNPIELLRSINYQNVQQETIQKILKNPDIQKHTKIQDFFMSILSIKNEFQPQDQSIQSNNTQNLNIPRDSHRSSSSRFSIHNQSFNSQQDQKLDSQSNQPVNKIDKIKRMNSFSKGKNNEPDAIKCIQANTPGKVLFQQTQNTENSYRNSVYQANENKSGNMTKEMISEQLKSKSSNFTFSNQKFNSTQKNNNQTNTYNSNNKENNNYQSENSQQKIPKNNLYNVFNSTQKQQEKENNDQFLKQLMEEKQKLKKQVFQDIDIRNFICKSESWLAQDFQGLNPYDN